MRPFGFSANIIGIATASALSHRGAKRGSLSRSGAIAAFIVGFISIACGLRGFLLLFFYLVGTAATKYRHSEKMLKDATAQVGAQRSAGQVLACSFVGVICSLCHAMYCGEEQPIDFQSSPMASALYCGLVAHYATCLGDTLASELGILANHQPILLTKPWLSVPPGTNGGITLSGTLWSGAGGLVISVGALSMDTLSGIETQPLQMAIFGVVCGVAGSFLDSILGATVQSSFYDDKERVAHSGEEDTASLSKFRHVSGVNILTNAQVNLVSVIATTVLGATAIGPIVFSSNSQL